MWAKQKQNGFTIVELLIVIVVIAILAAVALIAYGGTQMRARNMARVASANQVIRLIASYKATNGAYPPSMQTNNGLCVTVDNVCTDYSGTAVAASNSTLMTELRTIGVPPPNSNRSGQTIYYGIYFDTYDVRYVNSQLRPGFLIFWLEGNDQDCKVSGVVEFVSGGAYPTPQHWRSSTTGYTYGHDDPNVTECYVSV